MCLLKVADQHDPGKFGEGPPPPVFGEGGDEAEEEEEEKEEEERGHLGHGAPPPGQSFVRETIMNQPVAPLQQAANPVLSPPAAFLSHYRPGEMAAIVTALTQVVSGRPAAGTSHGTLLPAAPPPPSAPLSAPFSSLTDYSHSTASWIGQKRGREEGSSSQASQFAPLRGYGMFGDLIASIQPAEPSTSLPSGTYVIVICHGKLSFIDYHMFFFSTEIRSVSTQSPVRSSIQKDLTTFPT